MPTHPATTLATKYLRLAARGNDSAVDTLAALAGETLTGLGATADHIAATLTQHCTQGHLADGRENPAARHLVAMLGATSANVDTDSATVQFDLPDGDELSVEDIELPDAIREFIDRFDDGEYEHLIDRTATRPVRTRYLRSEANDMDGHDTRVRGCVVEVIDRRGTSDPLPDHLIDAVAAAGLAGEDVVGRHCSNTLRLYEGDLCVATVWGSDDLYYPLGGGEVLCMEGIWRSCSGVPYCSLEGIAHPEFRSRDEALAHALEHLGETCRWRFTG